MKSKKADIFILALIMIIIGAIFFSRSADIRGILEFFKPDKPKSTALLKDVIIKTANDFEQKGKLKIIQKTGVQSLEFSEAGLVEQYMDQVASLAPDVRPRKDKTEILIAMGTETIIIPYTVLGKKKLPQMAIVIDDIGEFKPLGEKILAMDGVTLSIIPGLKYSRYFAEKGQSLGKDILVHIPMEPKNKEKYNGSLKELGTDMDGLEIAKLAEYYLDAIPEAKGVNNHMGSKFTEDPKRMKLFLTAIKDKKLFFLDSKTSPKSKGYSLASSLGIPSAKRDVFLDNDLSEEKISQQLDLAVETAQKHGAAVVIGHPHRATVKVLQARLKEIRKTVDIVPVSKLIKQ